MKTHRSRKCISLSYHEITETSSRHLEWLKKMCWSKRFDAVFPFEKTSKYVLGHSRNYMLQNCSLDPVINKSQLEIGP